MIAPATENIDQKYGIRKGEDFDITIVFPVGYDISGCTYTAKLKKISDMSDVYSFTVTKDNPTRTVVATLSVIQTGALVENSYYYRIQQTDSYGKLHTIIGGTVPAS